jgi:hypothetical protein
MDILLQDVPHNNTEFYEHMYAEKSILWWQYVIFIGWYAYIWLKAVFMSHFPP